MDQAEFRQRAMIHAMQGLLASSDGWCGDKDAKELARRAVLFADALLEANTIDDLTPGRRDDMTDGHDGGKHGISWGGSGEPTPPTETHPLGPPQGQSEQAGKSCARCFHQIEAFVQMCPAGGICVAAPTERVETSGFEDWWKKEYEGKLNGSGFTIELAFKEVSEKTWKAARAAVAPSPAGEGQESRLAAAIELLERTIPFTQCDSDCDCEGDRLFQETVAFLKAGKQ